MKSDLNALRQKVAQVNHQGSAYRYPARFFRVLLAYWPLGQYMLRTFGWKSWCTFWFTKLFVVDEGGEYDFSALWLRRFPLSLRHPFKVEIEHTTVCNKRCIYCAHTHWKEPQQQMTFDRFKQVIDSMPGLKWVNMAGIGSAFLHRDFARMLEYLRSQQVSINFVDEFDFFEEDMARKVIELGVNSIYVSFDGATRATYEKVKRGCSYDKALTNIRRLLRLKAERGSPFPVIHFRYLVSRENYLEMADYLDLIASLPNRGVLARVEFIGMIPFSEVAASVMPIREIPETLIHEIYLRALRHRINLWFSHEDPEALPDMSACTRWTEPFVLVTGDVIADCAILMQGRREFLRKISLGNVFQKPFPEIWNSATYRRLRQTVIDPQGQVPVCCADCCAFDTKTRARRYGIWDYPEEIEPLCGS